MALLNVADVAKLVDALDLGSSAARCESSSLSIRTIQPSYTRLSSHAGTNLGQ